MSHHRVAPFAPWDMPIHPRIAEHLGLKWASHDLKYKLAPFGERVTWDQYCQRYVTHDWNEPLQRCLAVANQNLPRAELESLAGDLENRCDQIRGIQKRHTALCRIYGAVSAI